MSEYGVLEAKNRFSELIERAERGESVVITRHGKPVIQWAKVESDADLKRTKAIEAVEWIKTHRPKTRITHDEIREWINEGRR